MSMDRILKDQLSRPRTLTLCAVHGAVAPRAMCGSIIVGGKHCGFKGVCVHQRPDEPTATAQPAPKDSHEH